METALHLFHFSEYITPQDVMKALSISRQTATRRLSAMVASGLLQRRGKGPMVRYEKIVEFICKTPYDGSGRSF